MMISFDIEFNKIISKMNPSFYGLISLKYPMPYPNIND